MESIVGGAAAIKAWPARNDTGAAVRVGDPLMLDFDTARNGYDAIIPLLTNQKDYVAPVGVVLGATGAEFPDQADIMLGMKGVFSTRVESTQDIVVEDLLYLSAGNRYLVTLATQPAFGATPGTTAAADAVAPTAATSTPVAAADAVAPTAVTSTAIAAAAIPSGSSIVASPATLTSLAAPTAFAATHIIAANELAAGDIIEIYASGTFVAINGADTQQVELRFAGDAFLTSPALVNVAGDVWVLRGTVVVRTIGAAGTWVGSGQGHSGTPSVAAGAVDVPFADFIGSTVDDTTAPITIDVLVTHSANSAGNQTRMDVLNVQVIRPVAAASLINELRTDFNALRLDLEAAAVPIRTTANALVTLANELKDDFNRMRTDLEAAAVPIRTTVGALVTLANEEKVDINQHATIIGDTLEPMRIRAIALAGRTANSEGLIDCYWLGVAA